VKQGDGGQKEGGWGRRWRKTAEKLWEKALEVLGLAALLSFAFTAHQSMRYKSPFYATRRPVVERPALSGGRYRAEALLEEVDSAYALPGGWLVGLAGRGVVFSSPRRCYIVERKKKVAVTAYKVFPFLPSWDELEGRPGWLLGHLMLFVARLNSLRGEPAASFNTPRFREGVEHNLFGVEGGMGGSARVWEYTDVVGVVKKGGRHAAFNVIGDLNAAFASYAEKDPRAGEVVVKCRGKLKAVLGGRR